MRNRLSSWMFTSFVLAGCAPSAERPPAENAPAHSSPTVIQPDPGVSKPLGSATVTPTTGPETVAAPVEPDLTGKASSGGLVPSGSRVIEGNKGKGKGVVDPVRDIP